MTIKSRDEIKFSVVIYCFSLRGGAYVEFFGESENLRHVLKRSFFFIAPRMRWCMEPFFQRGRDRPMRAA